MKRRATLALALLTATTSIAQNPIITHIYTADPTARVYDGKLYLYPSSDTVPPEGVDMPRFCMPGYHGFSLEGGSTWRDHGWILKENDVPWGDRDTYAMWAPDCIKKDGKYYYFYPAKPKDGNGKMIGMGVSDSPMGPFKWEKQPIDGVRGIDPGLLLDDDNQAYLFYGGGQTLYVAPLSDDMKSIKQAPIVVENLPAGYKEGSFPFKKDGIYYFTFAHVFADEGYTIGYATSDKPMGPYTYRGKIMDNIDNGTNHHSIVKYKDRWILFYHFWHLSGFNKMRSACADYMRFKPDGTIFKVKPTLRGIGAPMAGDTIQIDRYNEISGAQTALLSSKEPAGWMVCEARHNSYVIFKDVDFGNGEAKKIQARFASGQRTGSFEVRVGSATGDIIATFPIHYTGGWDNWETIESEIQRSVKGVKDICIVFKGEPGSTKTVNLNWLLMNN